jgi:hypothetical protein
MKKYIFILFLSFFCFSIIPDRATGADKTKIETVKQDVVKAIDSTLKDSAAVASIISGAEKTIEEMPGKGSGFWTYFLWILGFVYFVVGIIASHYPTKKSLWWLRLIPLIMEHFIVPKNKRLSK